MLQAFFVPCGVIPRRDVTPGLSPSPLNSSCALCLPIFTNPHVAYKFLSPELCPCFLYLKSFPTSSIWLFLICATKPPDVQPLPGSLSCLSFSFLSLHLTPASAILNLSCHWQPPVSHEPLESRDCVLVFSAS